VTTAAQRFLPDLAGLPDAAAAFLAEHRARLAAVTPRRVGRELLGVLVIVLCDVHPGWLGGTGPDGLLLVGLGALYAGLYLLRLAFPAVAVLTAGYVVMSSDHGGLALLIALSYAAGYRIVSWQRALITAVLALALHMLAWQSTVTGMTGLFGSFLMVTVFGLAVAIPFLVGRYAAQRAALVTAVQEREQGMRQERAMLSRQVRLRERNRIARDMHDSLGHRLSLISVHAGALSLDPDLDDKHREAVQVLRGAALTAMDELRGVLGVLRRDEEPEDESARRTVEAVDDLVEGARTAGVGVSLVRGGQPRVLPVRVSHAAYRVAQEGLTNATKHAPGASVRVTVKYEPDALVVEVRNNPTHATIGRARSAHGPGVGLIGLGERVRLAGGMLHVGALPSGGFRVAAVLPYEDTDATALADAEDTDAAGRPLGDGAKPTSIRKWAGVGSIVAAGSVVLAVVGGFTWAGTQNYTGVVTGEVFDSVRVGDAESAVLARLPAGAEPPLGDLSLGAAPEPEGARCVYRVADDQAYTTPGDKIVRFCFADGELVEKNTHLRKA
jgi:signal transduction histidine kinase